MLNQLPSIDGINKTDQIDFQYHYKFALGSRGSETKERFPLREFDVKNPAKYDGFLGHQKVDYQRMCSDVFFVNGIIEKCDGNYLRDFRTSTIQDSRIQIGAYPQSNADVSHLRKQGITAVVNLMTDPEISERNVSWDQMQEMYQSNGIKIIQHCPLNE